MKRWPNAIGSITQEEIRRYCVEDVVWQNFRERLKGLSTERKLDTLWLRLEEALVFNNTDGMRRYYVQVWNYLNALKRGGQLNDNLEVQR